MSNWKPCPPEKAGTYWLRKKVSSRISPAMVEYTPKGDPNRVDPLGQREAFLVHGEHYPAGEPEFQRIVDDFEYQEVEKWRE